MGRGPLNITGRSKIELYAVAACVPFAIGAVLWAASINSKADAAAVGVAELKPVAVELIKETSELKAETRGLKEEMRFLRDVLEKRRE